MKSRLCKVNVWASPIESQFSSPDFFRVLKNLGCNAFQFVQYKEKWMNLFSCLSCHLIFHLPFFLCCLPFYIHFLFVFCTLLRLTSVFAFSWQPFFHMRLVKNKFHLKKVLPLEYRQIVCKWWCSLLIRVKCCSDWNIHFFSTKGRY